MSDTELPKPTTSAKRIAANRANAAKSTGPTSVEGKRKSAANSLRANSLARSILVEGEDRAAFNAHVDRLNDHFQPANDVESTLLNTVIVSGWRQLRIREMERAFVQREVNRQDYTVSAENRPTRVSIAFNTLGGAGGGFELFIRNEIRYDRQYHRALRHLNELQDKRRRAEKKLTETNPMEVL